jgi:glycosyltransferase involved in cell wall biosynthesis
MQDNSIPEIELSVVAPMYNEEGIIRQSVEKMLSVMEKLTIEWEVFFVNDGSTDNTLAIAQEAVGDNPRAQVISYNVNRGRGYALRTGFDCSRGKYVVATESDMSWGEDVVERLYRELIDSRAEIVIASPYAKGGALENVPAKRAFLSRMGNQILKRTVPRNITMLSGMTRGYVGDFIRSLPLEEDRKEIHLEIISKSVMLGCHFSEIPAILRWDKATDGKPKRKSKFKAGKLIVSHLMFGFNEAPILLFGTVGSISALVGVCIGLYLSYLYFIRGEIIGDRIVLIMTTIFLILVGLSMFLFCFLSYQIKFLRQEIFKLRYKIT